MKLGKMEMKVDVEVHGLQGHAETCPICHGTGKVEDLGTTVGERTCHGCDGTGWVSVPGKGPDWPPPVVVEKWITSPPYPVRYYNFPPWPDYPSDKPYIGDLPPYGRPDVTCCKNHGTYANPAWPVFQCPFDINESPFREVTDGNGKVQ